MAEALRALQALVAEAAPSVEKREEDGNTPVSATDKPPPEVTRPQLSAIEGAASTAESASSAAPGADQADRVRFVQRVARAFEAAGDGGGTVRLRLHPPELGGLRLELVVRNGAMWARLEAETPAARSLLLDNLPALRDRLAEQNIKVEQFDIDLMDHSRSGFGQQTPDQPSPEQRASAVESAVRRRQAAAETPALSPSPRRAQAGRLDVII